MELKTKAIKATGWYTAVRVWTQTLSWGVSLILARIFLTPEDFGLFGMALSVIAFFELFQEMGLGSAIIQRQNISRQQVNGVFWIVLSTSLVLCLATFFISNIAAWFYEEPRLIWVIRTLGLLFLLNALGIVPYSLLSKEIDFRRRSLAEAASVTLSVGVSIALAYWGYGFWALVGGQIIRFAIKNVALCVLCRWAPSFDVSFVGMKGILEFGLHVSAANAVKTLSAIANTMIVAKVLGSSALGFYSMAHTLGTNPLHKLFTSVITQLSLPIFSKLQNDDIHLRKYFLKISKYLALIALPSQIGLALIGADLIIVLLTDKWMPILELFLCFCLGGIFYILPLPSSPVLSARGKPRVVFWIQVFTGAVIGTGCLVGTQFGLRGVAIAWLLTFPTSRTLLLLKSLKELDLSVWAYVKNIWEPIIATIAMAIVVLVTQEIAFVAMEPLVRLIGGIIVGAVVYTALLMILDKQLVPEMRDIAYEMFSHSRA